MITLKVNADGTIVTTGKFDGPVEWLTTQKITKSKKLKK